MQEPAGHSVSAGPARAQNQQQPILRFVEGKPHSKQAKQATKALIRAHASRFSWARLERPSYKSRVQPSVYSPWRRKPQEPDAGSSRNRLISEFIDGNYQEVDVAQRDDLDSWHGVSLEVTDENTLTPRGGVTRPLASVGIGHIDPFESYPSSLPRDVVSPLLDQG